MSAGSDPTAPVRHKAAGYEGVEQGTSCTQTSFRVGKKAFLFIGEQGGHSKAMFKLKESLPTAEELAAKEPENFEVGKFGWVTARFGAEDPLPGEIWEKWLDESYDLSLPKRKKKASG